MALQPDQSAGPSPWSLVTEMLAEFHAALGDEPGRGNAALRITLHDEEGAELLEALEGLQEMEGLPDPSDADQDRACVARELADVVYIAYGTAHAFDIDLDAAVAEIHRAAMSKVRRPNGEPPVTREDGKVMKPPEFEPPDMTAAIGGWR